MASIVDKRGLSTFWENAKDYIAGKMGLVEPLVAVPGETAYEEVREAALLGRPVSVWYDDGVVRSALVEVPYDGLVSLSVDATFMFNEGGREMYFVLDDDSWNGPYHFDWGSVFHESGGGWFHRAHYCWFEAWYKATSQNITINAGSGNLYRSELRALELPGAITGAGWNVDILHVDVNVAHNNYPCWGMLASLTSTGFNYYAMSGGSRNASPNYTVTAHVVGTL